MKNTNCESVIESFLEKDKGEHLDLQTTLHLLTCKKCRTLVRMCTLAHKASTRTLYIPTSINGITIKAIIKRLNPGIKILDDENAKPISLSRWIVSGLILVLAFSLFSFFATSTINPMLQITIYLSFSAFICIFCAFFVGSNLDFFVKKIDKTFNIIS